MKVLKILTAIAFAVVLSGCYQTVSGYDIERAIRQCEGLENVQRILADFTGTEDVTCKDNRKSDRIR